MYMVTGFAGYLLFMRSTRKEGSKYFGQRNGVEYEIKDDSAAYFHELWNANSAEQVVDAVLSNITLWDAELNKLPGFGDVVKKQLNSMMETGVFETVSALVLQSNGS
jgi:tagaturonate reductase